MQLLFTNSSEISNTKGLDLIPGFVNSISESPDFTGLPLPHIGWSMLNSSHHTFPSLRRPFYFVHSFMATPTDTSHVMATSSYGSALIPAVVRCENVLGYQFHPERSAEQGLNLLSSTIQTLLSHQ